MDARTLKTPETLPWIPPGKPQDGSSNKFAHKKGSIASRINEQVNILEVLVNLDNVQVASKKRSLVTGVRNLSASILSKVSSSDSGK